MSSSKDNGGGAIAGGRTNLKAPEGRYMLHSERLDGMVPFSARRPCRLTVAPLMGGAEEGLYAVFNVAEALYISPFNETHAPPIRRLQFPPPAGGGGPAAEAAHRRHMAFGRVAGSASPGSEAASAVGSAAASEAAPHPLCHAFCEQTRDGSDLLVGMANGEVALMSLRAQIKNAPPPPPPPAASAAGGGNNGSGGGASGGDGKPPKAPAAPKPPSAAQLAALAATAAKPTLTAMLNPCETAYDSSRVVAVAWVPGTDGLRFAVAHASGVIGLYQKNTALVAASLPKGAPLPRGIPAPHAAPFSHHNLALTQAAATGRSLLSQLSAAAQRASGGGADLIARDRGPALPAHVVAPVALVRVPGGGINDIAFSPDGQRLAVACRDGALRIYDYRRAMADALIAAEAVAVPVPRGEDYPDDAESVPSTPQAGVNGGGAGAFQVRLGNRAGPNDKGLGLPLPPLPPLPQPHVTSNAGPSGGVPPIQLPLVGGYRSYYGGVLCCCWSPDGRYLAAGGEDDSVAVYCVADRAVVAWGEGHDSWVSRVAFDPLVAGNGVGSSAAAGGLLDPVGGGGGGGGGVSAGGAAAARSAGVGGGGGATAPPGAPGAPGPRTVERQYRIASGGQDCAVCLWDVVIEEDEAIVGPGGAAAPGADLRLPPLGEGSLPVAGPGAGASLGGGGAAGAAGGRTDGGGAAASAGGVKRVASSPHVAVPTVSSAAALAALADGAEQQQQEQQQSVGGGGGGTSGGAGATSTGGGGAGASRDDATNNKEGEKKKKKKRPTPEELTAAAHLAHARAAAAHAEARRLAVAEEQLVAKSLRRGGKSLARAVAAREQAVLAPSARRAQMTVIPPIVQHKLHLSPVSDVAFTEEAVLTADHAGVVKCWLRPATVRALEEATTTGAATAGAA